MKKRGSRKREEKEGPQKVSGINEIKKQFKIICSTPNTWCLRAYEEQSGVKEMRNEFFFFL